MDQRAQKFGGQLARAFVDGHDAPHVERGLALVLVAGEDFELGVEHGELARVAVEFHLAEERHLHSLGQHVGEIPAMEPLAHEDGARGIGEAGFEHPQAAPLESAHFDGAHVGDHGGHLARRELGDGLHVAAVLIAERHVAQQVFHRGETLGFEQPGTGRSDSFDEGEGSGKVHARVPQCTMLTGHPFPRVPTPRRVRVLLSRIGLAEKARISPAVLPPESRSTPCRRNRNIPSLYL